MLLLQISILERFVKDPVTLIIAEFIVFALVLALTVDSRKRIELYRKTCFPHCAHENKRFETMNLEENRVMTAKNSALATQE